MRLFLKYIFVLLSILIISDAGFATEIKQTQHSKQKKKKKKTHKKAATTQKKQEQKIANELNDNPEAQAKMLASLFKSVDSLNTLMNIPIIPKTKRKIVKEKKFDDTVIRENAKTVEKGIDFIKLILDLSEDSLQTILANPNKYNLQIIYTQINRDVNNYPWFKEYRYLVDEKKYFYPASLVKLPVCALAMQKLNETDLPGLTIKTPMLTDATPNTCQKITFKDSTSENGKPTIAHYIKKMMLVSDNDAYSRVYEYLGRDYILEKLNLLGLSKIRIVHRFDANCKLADNACSNPIFFPISRDTIYKQEAFCSTQKIYHPTGNALVGKAHMTNSGKKIMKPKNFINMNYMSLIDIDGVLKRIIFPNAFAPEDRFSLTENNYSFLRKYMSMLPRESSFPHYPDSLYEDSYKKYFLYGTTHGVTQNDSIRIFNVVGQSYGFLADCAYIVDLKNNIEFFLSAVVYTNKNEVINDGIYEYKSLGFPFLANLGKTFYKFEKVRKREFTPKLDEFKMDYK